MVQIGEYVVLKEGEESPLGKLILAEHRILKRKAALKRLFFSLGDQSMRELEEKIVSLANLDHPHLARLQNVSFNEQSCYVAYDWHSPCVNLREYLQQNVVDEKTLFLIFTQIASALTSMHNSSVVHLGVKASNVLIDVSKGDPISCLTDTGLSHLFPPRAFLYRILEECVKREDLSSFWESFYSLAPEQKEGKFSYKSDMYAFGVLLYYSLMGVYPEGRFPLPSQVRKDLFYDWDSLLTHLLDPLPENRPDHLLSALENVLPKSESSFTLHLKPGEIHRPQFEPDPGAIFHGESSIVQYRPEFKEVKEASPIETKMVLIPGGTFQRGSHQGSRDESPRHHIHLSAFAIDVHPVTNEQFVRFLEAMGGEKDGNNNDMIRLRDSRIKRLGGKLNIESGYSRHPVVGVSWYGALAYAKWVGKRLPTEAEWEVASLGGLEEAVFPTGATIEKGQANFFSADTVYVMSYPPNGYGLYDMAGNVYEWCEDWYDYHYYDQSVQEPNNPLGPVQGVYRVLRGGCWKSLKDDLRCSHRHRNNPGTMNATYGFRCVADVQSR